MKLKKRTKVGRYRGSSTHGWGARKKHISSGNRGGFGMSGTGKMAGHKKTFLSRYFGTSYFGKQGITSRGTEKDKSDVINIRDLVKDIEMYKKKYAAKDGTLNLKTYKILGEGEVSIKIIAKVRAASKSAIEKIKKAGGNLIIINSEDEKKE